ncbi:MAG: thioredoxin [Patescibacteria group bacterium]|nr:thioredoxin [Patescibacteria group bacterium]
MSITILKDENFEEMNKSAKAVVDFSASWCGPCKMLAPVFDSVSEKVKNIDFYKVDVDEAEQSAANFSVMSIPTIIFFENGEEKGRVSGYMAENQLIEEIKKMLR